jgi:Fe-S-cluster containining protein
LERAGSPVFYSGGLRFTCTRCSACCRYESGYVFLSQTDLDVLVKALRVGYTEFMERYCRWVPQGGGTERLSLIEKRAKEKSGMDCVFWKEGCSVYEARPLQCRAFPFWPSILNTFSGVGAWKAAARDCPGMGQGELHSADTIQEWLDQQRAEPAILRQTTNPKGGY